MKKAVSNFKEVRVILPSTEGPETTITLQDVFIVMDDNEGSQYPVVLISKGGIKK